MCILGKHTVQSIFAVLPQIQQSHRVGIQRTSISISYGFWKLMMGQGLGEVEWRETLNPGGSFLQWSWDGRSLSVSETNTGPWEVAEALIGWLLDSRRQS